MRKKISFVILFFSIVVFSQNKLFQNKISENNLSPEQKVSKDLASTYLFTKYYLQASFDLNSDLQIILPTDREIVAKFRRIYNYSNKAQSYVYTIENEPESELVFSKYENIITGMYSSVTGEKVIFHQTESNVFAVSEVSSEKMINQDAKDDYLINTPSVSGKINSNVCLDTTPVCPVSRIDVLAVYTDAAQTAWGGAAQSNSFIATAITNFNTALQNSGVSNVTINLVYSGAIDYTESGSLSTDLPRFANNGDGFMDNVHSLRTMYGADICALVTSTPTNTCGLGYLNSNPGNYSANAAFSATVFSCVVSNYSMAHEMGHNMGLNHDWYVDTNTNPCSHHHGYVNRTAITLGTSSVSSQRWRTIMAYNNECSASGFNCARINRWANPVVNYNSEPTGIAIGNTNPSNEAFGFSRFACVVANFVPSSTLATTELTANEKDFSLFPNPAKDILNIRTKDNEKYIFKIVNIVGQIVLTTDKKEINLEGLPPGDYFLNIYNDKNSFIESKKFIIK